MARGISEKNGTCLGLSHFTTMIEPRDVLEKIQKKLKKQGCNPESIEFYLVGGQLPYRDNSEVGGLSTIEIESEFLSLSKEFNIVGVQFNLAEDDESLSVIISEDEIVWTVWDFKFDSDVTSSNESQKIAKRLKAIVHLARKEVEILVVMMKVLKKQLKKPAVMLISRTLSYKKISVREIDF